MRLHRRSSLLLVATAVLALAGAGTAAHCGVIFSSFGPGDSYRSGVGWTVATNNQFAGTQAAAVYFDVPLALDYTLDRIEVAAFGASDPCSLTVQLMSSSSGLPGNVLESFALPLDNSQPSGIFAFTSALRPTLTAGDRYWVAMVASDQSWGAWNQSVADTRDMGFSFDGGATCLRRC